MKCYSALLTW